MAVAVLVPVLAALGVQAAAAANRINAERRVMGPGASGGASGRASRARVIAVRMRAKSWVRAISPSPEPGEDKDASAHEIQARYKKGRTARAGGPSRQLSGAMPLGFEGPAVLSRSRA